MLEAQCQKGVMEHTCFLFLPACVTLQGRLNTYGAADFARQVIRMHVVDFTVLQLARCIAAHMQLTAISLQINVLV